MHLLALEGSFTPLDSIGGISLLLWGLHMVHSGVMRGYGAEVRHFLGAALKSRFKGFLAGLAVTALLQSSTATALMTTSLASRGLIGIVPALAIMLGANVGTTLIVQVLSFNVSSLSPVFITLGVIAFKRGARTRTRDLGRVAIGLGLIFVSLRILLSALIPLSHAPIVPTLLDTINEAPLICIFVTTCLSWLTHSSVAVMLLIISLAASHLVVPSTALALVAGANLGSALNPLFEGSTFGDPATRRVPIGNLVTRVTGCILTVFFLGFLSRKLAEFQPDTARLAIEFHVIFNCTMAVIFMPALKLVAAALVKLLPDKPKLVDPLGVAYLDETAINTPSVAIACAAREVLHAGDIIETMLRDGMTALMTNDRKLVDTVSSMDNAVDRLDEAIKLYVTKITRLSLDPREARRAMEVVAFSINLEHIGDIIDKNLIELAAKKIKRKLQFSKEGASEIEAFHRRVLENLKLAFGVFMSANIKIAERLLAEKSNLRQAEAIAAENHLARLREGRLESIETSSLHLDVIRDLRRIHSHICSVAYPVLNGGKEDHASAVSLSR